MNWIFLQNILVDGYGVRQKNRWVNGGSSYALNAQKASFEAEVHSYEKTVLNAFKEAKNAIVDFNKIKKAITSDVNVMQEP